MKLAKHTILLLAICGMAWAIDPAVAMGCPNCKDALHTDQSAMAFAISIMFLMSMPFVIFGAWMAFFVRCRTESAVQLSQPMDQRR